MHALFFADDRRHLIDFQSEIVGRPQATGAPYDGISGAYAVTEHQTGAGWIASDGSGLC